MLKNTTEMYGLRLVAMDGPIGHIKDLYFDDMTWAVRYLVADTGSWLSGQLVLLTPCAFGRFDRDGGTLNIALTRAQIEACPPIEDHRPVSRQYEIDYFRYYGWPTYWTGGGVGGPDGYPLPLPPTGADASEEPGRRGADDRHLRSTRAVTGYDIQASDGQLGRVSGLIIDDQTWALQNLVVGIGHWYAAREILISTQAISSISYMESKVFVDLSRADIEYTSANELAIAGTAPSGAAGFFD